MSDPTRREQQKRRPSPLRAALLGVAAALLVLVGAVPLATPAAAAAATPRVKVVVIVGPVESLTSRYRDYAERIAQAAEAYGADVRRIYSPDATWQRVLDNIGGANIVAYLGHGNGFPSPYGSTLYPYTQDGFGLNRTAGAGDSNVTYYGEYYIARDIRLAPNAVVFLNHACYSAGSSEPGRADPTLDVARQRVDNFAAGFIKAGARAVFALAYPDPVPYLGELFTTHKTIQEIYEDGYAWDGRWVSRFDSSRSPGYRLTLDPQGGASDYYSALTTDPDLTAVDVTGAPFAATDQPPPDFVVPGKAVVVADAAVYSAPDGAKTGQVLRVGTYVSLTSGPYQGADTVWFRAGDLTGGWLRSSRLDPADSTGPRVWEFGPEPAAFSPNGDGVKDAITFTATLSEGATWKLRVQRSDGTTLVTRTGTGQTIRTTWNGSGVADGSYRVVVDATDALGNVGDRYIDWATVDTVAPSLGSFGTSAPVTPLSFSPDGDGYEDTAAFGYSVSEASTLQVAVTNASGATVRNFTVNAPAGSGSFTWDGRNGSGARVADGRYTVRLTPRDPAGNQGAARSVEVAVLTLLRDVLAGSPLIFYPDGDGTADTTTFAFTLTRDATVTWEIQDTGGKAVLKRWTGRSTTAGTYSFDWEGRGYETPGVVGPLVALPQDLYYSVVTAKDATGTMIRRAAAFRTAFRVEITATSGAPGEQIVVTTWPAEPSSSAPVLVVSQPGLSAVSYTMPQINSKPAYRVTYTVRAGAAGPATFTVKGKDANGQSQSTTVAWTVE
ncbi:MAG: hypothetical protein A2X23_07080 [Chloroflexi bacterium GWC2_73_18]|nr:MAG: hypothetical protein A2X23_07080 [Chloroflexi bacterium GWC2_73_18]